MDELAEASRPVRLSDMVGQKEAVADARRFLERGERRNLLISGDSGVGKTTHALAYARGLLCPHSGTLGDACGRCEDCLSFRMCPAFHYLNGAVVELDYLRFLMSEVQGRSSIYACQVFVVDEAKFLAPKAWEMMQLEMERPRTPAVFIFVLIDHEDAPAPVRGRASDIRLQRPTLAEAVEVVDRTLKMHQIECDPAARPLLPHLSRDYRGLVQAIDKLASASTGGITLPLLQQRFGADRGERVLRYLEAIAAGRSVDGVAAMAGSALSPMDAGRAIRDFLVFLRLHHLPDSDPSIHCTLAPALTPQDRRQALAETLAGAQPAARLQRMIDFWSGPPPEDDAELKVRLLAFERFAHEPAVPAELAPALPRNPSVAPSRQRYGGAGRARTRTQPSSPALDLQQIRGLYSSASFALQHLDAPFNMAITCRGLVPGPCDAAFTKKVGSICHRLGDRIPVWTRSKGASFHYIALFGQTADGRAESLVIGHVPPTHLARSVRRLQEPAKGCNGLDVCPTIYAGLNPRAAVRTHWDLVRRLWWWVSHDLRTPAGQRLVEALAPRGDPGPGGAVEGRRYATSTSISISARREAATQLAFLSAFDDQAWDHLYTGWERAEVQVRRLALAQRSEALAELEDRFPLRDGPDKPVFEARRAALVSGWGSDPKALPRSWKGWW